MCTNFVSIKFVSFSFFGFQNDLLCVKEKSDYRTSRVISQATLASLYGNNHTRRSSHLSKSSIDPKSKFSPSHAILSDKTQSHNHHKEFLKVEDEERPLNIVLGTKRTHIETTSPGYDHGYLPSNMEEANAEAPGNGFMTAKTKLVTSFSLKILILFFRCDVMSVSALLSPNSWPHR